jgi:outer membrane protein assembly factor BamA
MIISGSRTTISAFAGVSQNSGADSLAASQGFFTGTAVSLGLQVGYQLAPRTSVSAGLSSSITDYGDGTTGSSAVGFSGYSVNLSGSWAATERLSFGPSLSYSTNSSDGDGDFDTWGLSMQGSYKASERIQVSASLGFQYVEYSQEGASSDISPTGSLNASYQIDELWSWSASIQSGLTPSPTGSSYVINGWMISSNLNRQLLIGSAGIGVVMDFSNYQSAGPTGFFQANQASQASEDNQQNIGLMLNYSRPLPLFNDRLGFSTSLIYTVNSGDFEYTQVLLNAGLNMAF